MKRSRCALPLTAGRTVPGCGPCANGNYALAVPLDALALRVDGGVCGRAASVNAAFDGGRHHACAWKRNAGGAGGAGRSHRNHCCWRYLKTTTRTTRVHGVWEQWSPLLRQLQLLVQAQGHMRWCGLGRCPRWLQPPESIDYGASSFWTLEICAPRLHRKCVLQGRQTRLHHAVYHVARVGTAAGAAGTSTLTCFFNFASSISSFACWAASLTSCGDEGRSA